MLKTQISLLSSIEAIFLHMRYFILPILQLNFKNHNIQLSFNLQDRFRMLKQILLLIPLILMKYFEKLHLSYSLKSIYFLFYEYNTLLLLFLFLKFIFLFKHQRPQLLKYIKCSFRVSYFYLRKNTSSQLSLRK